MRKLLLFVHVFLISFAVKAQWVQQTFGNGFDFFSASFPSVNTGFACGYGNRLIKTTNGGTVWQDISFAGTASNLNTIFFVNENTGWLCSTDTLFYTTNCGVSWTSRITPIYGREIFFVNQNSGWISTGSYFLKTTNGGVNWSTISFISDGHIFFTDALTGWTTRGEFGNTTIYKSTNGGLNWNSQFTTTDFHYIYAFDFINVNTGWACGYRHTILKTTNGGINWVFQREVAGGSGLYTIDFVNENTGWAAGDFTNGSNVLYTTNGGQNWNETALPAGRLSKVQFVNNATGWIVGQNNKVFKTTNSGGLITSANTNNGSLPKNFVLHQNYPNPFNPVTRISFDTPPQPSPKGREQLVKLAIYDILGSEAAVLVSGNLNPGTYEVTWDASNYPSGVYYYKLETDGYSETKKMILLK